MKPILFICSVLMFFQFGSSQNYRLLPTCADSTETNNPIVLKGDKGDQGFAGKAGPKGIQGSRGFAGKAGRKGIHGSRGFAGEVGPKGIKGSRGISGEDGRKGEKGDIADCSEYLRNLRERLTVVESLLNETRSSTISCSDSNSNGVHHLISGEEVFCDNGWRVFQHRFDGSISFDRNWQDYKVGFGDISGEFWLGLEKLHHLTNLRSCSLRVDLWNFDDEFAYAEYSSFRIGSESSNYTLHVGGYNGTADDSLIDVSSRAVQNNQPFTTRDRDNDNLSGNCASYHSGAWWYNACSASRLNAARGTSRSNGNIYWSSWKEWNNRIKKTMMKIRCN